ncbi:polyamine aminopropyltransferase [Parasphingorhabdus sp. DH2-15]|uniref:polyamine aminopropyltransferase n=1 Tax=Parasphingorhabdus sp. DH2-15 TaxID=3444112 RepID=UPI003F6823C7
MSDEAEAKQPAGFAIIMLASVFVVATCGLVYELLAGTIASYLLGDSVTQFSTVIGTYLFAMGVGSWCSRYVKQRALEVFIRVEILIALIGGCTAALLFMLFPIVDSFRPILYALVFCIGFFVGLEIPLLIRILRGRFAFRELVSTVLTYDYVGALAASLIFPLILVPQLGLVRSGFAVGLTNIIIALLLIWQLRSSHNLVAEKIAASIVATLLLTGLLMSDYLQSWSESAAYEDPVIYSKSTEYQRIVLTRRKNDIRLHLNGNLQFSSRDEYRYHEALVLPALGRVSRPENVLIMGGGDGLAAREVLKHPNVKTITLVDLDAGITDLFKTVPALARLNNGALSAPQVTAINADGFVWARKAEQIFDLIIVDFPDPTNFAIGKLYSRAFYSQLSRLLADNGILVVQSTSPLVAPESYWTVSNTMENAGLQTTGYHAYVPSFGEWGFTMASHGPLPPLKWLPDNTRFLTRAVEKDLYLFPPDMARRPTAVNRLDNQALVTSFAKEWRVYDGR